MNTAVIYDSETQRVIGYYNTLRGAKIANTRKYSDKDYVASSLEEYDALPVKTATVKNLMSGNDVEIPLRDKGTCCDPSTERYWSM